MRLKHKNFNLVDLLPPGVRKIRIGGWYLIRPRLIPELKYGSLHAQYANESTKEGCAEGDCGAKLVDISVTIQTKNDLWFTLDSTLNGFHASGFAGEPEPADAPKTETELEQLAYQFIENALEAEHVRLVKKGDIPF